MPVRPLAADSRDNPGEAAHRVERDRTVFEAGLAGAGRHLLERQTGGGATGWDLPAFVRHERAVGMQRTVVSTTEVPVP